MQKPRLRKKVNSDRRELLSGRARHRVPHLERHGVVILDIDVWCLMGRER